MTISISRNERCRRAGAMGRHPLVALMLASIACSGSGQAQDVSLANGFISRREAKAAKHDAVYAKRLQLVAGLAQRVKTDSLRKLYLTALDAPRGQIDIVWDAIGCEYLRQIEQVGAPAAKRAQQHLRDSLKASPDIAIRWISAAERRSSHGSLQGCPPPSGTRVPDSLESLPFPNTPSLGP